MMTSLPRRSRRLMDKSNSRTEQSITPSSTTINPLSPKHEKRYKLRPGDFISYQSSVTVVENVDRARITKIYEGNYPDEVFVSVTSSLYPNSWVRVVESAHFDAPPPDLWFLIDQDNEDGVSFEFGEYVITEEERIANLNQSIDNLPGGTEINALVTAVNTARRSEVNNSNNNESSSQDEDALDNGASEGGASHVGEVGDTDDGAQKERATDVGANNGEETLSGGASDVGANNDGAQDVGAGNISESSSEDENSVTTEKALRSDLRLGGEVVGVPVGAQLGGEDVGVKVGEQLGGEVVGANMGEDVGESVGPQEGVSAEGESNCEIGAIGYVFRKRFRKAGWFWGRVVAIRPGAGMSQTCFSRCHVLCSLNFTFRKRQRSSMPLSGWRY